MVDVEELKIGDTIYGSGYGGAAEKCVVEEIKENCYIKVKNEIYTYIDKADKFHKTKQECQERIDNERNKLKQQYEEEINSIEDLVRFMYTHSISPCDECTDWIAREIAKKRAADFGIELEE